MKSKLASTQCNSNQSPITQCQMPQLPDIREKLIQCQQQQQQQQQQQGISSPERIKTARFPSVDMNGMLMMKDFVDGSCRQRFQEFQQLKSYSLAGNNDQTRQINEQNNQEDIQDLNNKKEFTIFEQNIEQQELLHQVTSQKLMNDSFMNCDYLFSETQGVVTGTHFSKQNQDTDDNDHYCQNNQNLLLNCIRETTIATDRPVVGDYVEKKKVAASKLRESTEKANKFKESPKSDRYSVTLSKVAPKAIANSLLQPILTAKKGITGQSSSRNKYNSNNKKHDAKIVTTDSTNFSFQDSMQIRQNLGSFLQQKTDQSVYKIQRDSSQLKRRSPKFKLELPNLNLQMVNDQDNKYNLPRQLQQQQQQQSRNNKNSNTPRTRASSNLNLKNNYKRSTTPKGTSKFNLSIRQSSHITPKNLNNKSFFLNQTKKELSKSVNITPKNKHHKSFQFKAPIVKDSNYSSKKSNEESKKQKKPRPRDIMQIRVDNESSLHTNSKRDTTPKQFGRSKSPRITPRSRQKLLQTQTNTFNNTLKLQRESTRKSSNNISLKPRASNTTTTSATATPRKVQQRKPVVEQEKKKFISKATLKRLNQKKKAQQNKQASKSKLQKLPSQKSKQSTKKSSLQYTDINPLLTTVSSNYSSNNDNPRCQMLFSNYNSSQSAAAVKIQRFLRKKFSHQIAKSKDCSSQSIVNKQGFQTPSKSPNTYNNHKSSLESSQFDVRLNTIKKKKEYQALPAQINALSQQNKHPQNPYNHHKDQQKNKPSFLTSNLMQSCVASFYATQMSIWRETLKMYSNNSSSSSNQ